MAPADWNEVNGYLKRTNKRVPILVDSLGLSYRCKRFLFSALAALVGPVQNIFSSPYTILIPLSPSPSKLGSQPCWVACLLVWVSEKNDKSSDADALNAFQRYFLLIGQLEGLCYKTFDLLMFFKDVQGSKSCFCLKKCICKFTDHAIYSTIFLGDFLSLTRVKITSKVQYICSLYFNARSMIGSLSIIKSAADLI
jgi:hypothetical protein